MVCRPAADDAAAATAAEDGGRSEDDGGRYDGMAGFEQDADYVEEELG